MPQDDPLPTPVRDIPSILEKPPSEPGNINTPKNFDEYYDDLINEFQSLCDRHKISAACILLRSPEDGSIAYSGVGHKYDQTKLVCNMARGMLNEMHKDLGF